MASLNTLLAKLTKPILTIASGMLVIGCATPIPKGGESEIGERARVAAANMQDAMVVDCQLPGRLMMLGGGRQYMTPGALTRLSAIDCRTRGGEYEVGNLAGGTLSLKRWLPVAEQGSAEAQYYVARIYANGMGGVPLDYMKASAWYQRAADQKYGPALQELGYLYEEGLGVPQDRLRGLNLQRQASGLGDELDYSWKLTAAKEDYEKRTAVLSAQLEATNSELESLRGELGRTRDKLAMSRRGLTQSESTVLALRAQLKTIKSDGGSAAHAKELEEKLAANESALLDARENTELLREQLGAQQAQLQARLQQSQTATAQLDELVTAGQDEAKSLRARLAQSEQRYIKSQQELADLRLDYRRQVDQLAAERDELEHARAKANDNAGAALLAVKEHDLELQSLRVKSLETELAAAKQNKAAAAATTTAGVAAQAAQAQAQVAQANQAAQAAQTAQAAQAGKAAQAEARNALLRTDLAGLQQRYDEQSKQLLVSQGELTDLRSKSQAERADIFNHLTAELAARSSDLTQKQHQIDSLESDTGLLKSELARLRDEQSRTAATNSTESGRTRAELQSTQAALLTAQQKVAEQRDALDEMRTDSAKERAALLKEQIDLQQRMTAGQAANELQIGSMKATIAARENLINTKNAQIAELEKKMPQAPAVADNDAAHLVGAGAKTVDLQPAPSVSANYYALIIGNGNYANMSGLLTPTRDAQSVSDLLSMRYGFKTLLLLDATRDQIMAALDKMSRELNESDRLLIYFAGHGDARGGPPERAFWLGTEADPNNPYTWIAAEYISDKIKQMKPKQILLVSDSCFNSSITHPNSTVIRRETTEAHFRVQWSRRARMVLTSGQNSPIGDSTGARRYSLFAKYFISVLIENDGLMSGETLAGEIANRMEPEAERMGIKQTPTYTTLQDANHDFGEFFFLPPAHPAQVVALNE